MPIGQQDDAGPPPEARNQVDQNLPRELGYYAFGARSRGARLVNPSGRHLSEIARLGPMTKIISVAIVAGQKSPTIISMKK